MWIFFVVPLGYELFGWKVSQLKIFYFYRWSSKSGLFDIKQHFLTRFTSCPWQQNLHFFTWPEISGAGTKVHQKNPYNSNLVQKILIMMRKWCTNTRSCNYKDQLKGRLWEKQHKNTFHTEINKCFKKLFSLIEGLA